MASQMYLAGPRSVLTNLQGFVPLPKSVKPERIEDNAKVYDFELSPEDMKQLDTNEYSPSAWDPTVKKLDE